MQEVCHQYWPDGSTKGMQKYGEYSVSILQATEQDGFIERVISITNPKVITGDKYSYSWCITFHSQCFSTSPPPVWWGPQGDSVSDVLLDPWRSVHLPSCHHGSHWAGVGGTEEDWEQTHRGPRQVSQLGGVSLAALYQDFFLSPFLAFWGLSLLVWHMQRNELISFHALTAHSNTVSRCGVFCSFISATECCKTEGIVDVFQVVKALRIQKPGSVLTVVSSNLP